MLTVLAGFAGVVMMFRPPSSRTRCSRAWWAAVGFTAAFAYMQVIMALGKLWGARKPHRLLLAFGSAVAGGAAMLVGRVAGGTGSTRSGSLLVGLLASSGSFA